MTRTPHIKITGNGQYPLVPLAAITISERPESGQESEVLFYNPRSIESFTADEMQALMTSIKEDGLQQPPIVRVTTQDGKKSGSIKSVELVAGERRLRSIMKLVESNEDCYDDTVNKMVPARQLFEQLPCKVIYNIGDDQALKIAFLENGQHQPLSTKEEVELVERLLKRDMNLDDISKMLNTNITWVSQTSNFRAELPTVAFDKLINGQLSRNVAVQILSYKPEDRQTAFDKAIAVEAEETTISLKELQETREVAQDNEMLAARAKQKAENSGDFAQVKLEERKQRNFGKVVKAATEKKSKVMAEAGVIRQSHLIKGAKKAKVAPKKAKALVPAMIHECFVELPSTWIEDGHRDSVTDELVPNDVLEIMVHVGRSILRGITDTEKVLREILIRQGIWNGTLDEEGEEEPAEPVEV